MNRDLSAGSGVPLRFAIIGAAAHQAPMHLRCLRELPGAEVVALCDIDAGGLAPRAAEAGCPAFVDHREMLRKTQPDVAVIVTPHPFHAPITLDCLEAGAHVLVEKPMAVAVGEADRMIEAADSAGRILAVNFQQRFRAVVERAHALVEAGAIGDLVRTLCVEPWYRPAAYYRTGSWRGTWAGEGGGVLMNQAPHTMDLLCHLAGLPAKVWGWTRTRQHAIECEDSAQALLEYPNGAPGYFQTTTVEAGSEGRIEIVGDRGALIVSGTRLTIKRFEPPLEEHMATAEGMFSSPEVEIEVEDIPSPVNEYLAVYLDLQAAIAEGRPPRVTGREALMSLELANAIIYSSHTDRPVTLPLDRAAYAELLSKLKAGSS